MITLRTILIEDKELLKIYLQNYLRELSTITSLHINTNYKYLDSYFSEEENRKAFFILNEGNIIGFVFINDYCLIKTNEIAIAEFYIQKAFRNKGFAEKAVKQVLKLSNKSWEVKTSIKNKVALSFWRNVIGKTEERLIKEDVVFSF